MNFRWLLLLRFRLSRTDLKSRNKLCWNGYVYNSNNIDSCCSLNIFTKLPFYYFSRQINVCYKLNARIWREINCAQKLRHIMQSETEIGTNWFFFSFHERRCSFWKKTYILFCNMCSILFFLVHSIVMKAHVIIQFRPCHDISYQGVWRRSTWICQYESWHPHRHSDPESIIPFGNSTPSGYF